MQKLDRLLSHAIALLGLAILAAIILTAGIAVRTSLVSRDATAYVESALPQLVGGWNPRELERRLVPEMVTPRVREALPPLFASFSALGKLKSLDKPAGRIGSGAYPGTTINGTWAAYAADAEFEGGRARIELVLKRVDDGWQIATFRLVPTPLPASPRPAPPKGAEGA